MLVDLRRASFDEFLAAIFDRPLPAAEGEPEWYFASGVDLATDPRHQIALFTQLFRAPRVLLDRYSVPQIEQGFWMFGGAMADYFLWHLWAPEVPWDERAACIAAIETVYAELFAARPFDTIDYMLPDLLADGYSHGTRRREDSEDRRVQDALLALFARLLERPDYMPSQYAGLHGLGHLRHPDGPQVIERFLAAHPDLNAEQAYYARQAAAGEVL